MVFPENMVGVVGMAGMLVMKEIGDLIPLGSAARPEHGLPVSKLRNSVLKAVESEIRASVETYSKASSNLIFEQL